MEKPFWLVWNPDHPTTPRVRYDNQKTAEAVAARMAKDIGLGAVFYVLQGKCAYQHQVKTERFPL